MSAVIMIIIIIIIIIICGMAMSGAVVDILLRVFLPYF